MNGFLGFESWLEEVMLDGRKGTWQVARRNVDTYNFTMLGPTESVAPLVHVWRVTVID